MHMDSKINPLIRQVLAGSDTDPDWDETESAKRIADKHGLDVDERRALCEALCRHGTIVFPEDIK